MSKEELLKALDEIKESYDAYFILNKYGTNTHQKQFDLLEQNVKGDKMPSTLNWIKHRYDCYYKDEFKDEKGTAFGYIRNLINEVEDDIIEQALIKAQEQEKVLKIIKEKRVDMWYLVDLLDQSYEMYLAFCKSEKYEEDYILTQEEFELLKEYFR